MQVDLVIEDAQWDAQSVFLTTSMQRILDLCHLPATCYVSIHGVDNAKIKEMNAEWRQKDSVTDVLSFPSCFERLEEYQKEKIDHFPMPCYLLGDIVLAYDFIKQEAEKLERDFRDHVVHLLVHGLLHLLGYDHIDDGDAQIMQAEEVLILKHFGIDNPYI